MYTDPVRRWTLGGGGFGRVMNAGSQSFLEHPPQGNMCAALHNVNVAAVKYGIILVWLVVYFIDQEYISNSRRFKRAELKCIVTLFTIFK